jgi:hypothetical protein
MIKAPHAAWLLIATLLAAWAAPAAGAQDAATQDAAKKDAAAKDLATKEAGPKDGTPGNASSAAPKTLRDLITASVKWYEVYPSAESKDAAEARTVLRWANNTRGSEDGVTVLFVHAGRPLAAVCIYPWAKHLVHDFESLSRDKIVARRDGEVVWQPQTAGVAFADIPGVPTPAETRALRLRQMKALAQKFQATLLGWKTDNSDREQLRLLTRPLYRYDPKEGAVTDGAVFAFAMGTDPEALLLVEAVKERGAAKWQYAFARRTSGELEARLGEAVVWNAERFPQQDDARKPHFTRVTPLPPDLEPGTVEPAKEKTP